MRREWKMRTAVMKRLGKAKEDQKGFTLIELLAVIVILAVIAAIAIPLIGNIIDKSKKDSDVSTARQIYDATKLYVTSDLNGTYPKSTTASAAAGFVSVDTLQKAGFLDKNIALPSTKVALNVTTSGVQFDDKGELQKVILIEDKTTGALTKDYEPNEVISVTSTK